MAVNHCIAAFTGWLLFYTPCATICLFSTFPTIYQLIKSQTKKQATPKLLFSVDLAFLISSCLMLLTITVNMFANIAGCTTHHNQHIFSATDLAMPICYMLQLYFLLLIFFVRLYYVFHGTILALSNALINLCTIIYCAIPALLIVSAIFYAVGHDSAVKLVSVIAVFLLIITLIISMIVLFIYKLVQVFKRAGNDEALMRIITKTTILTLTSLALTILSPTCLAISMSIPVPNVHVTWIANVLVLLDVYTNFVCVVLCYPYYDEYYMKFCGCLDRKCDIMCLKMAGVYNRDHIAEAQEEDIVIEESGDTTHATTGSAPGIKPSPHSSASITTLVEITQINVSRKCKLYITN